MRSKDKTGSGGKVHTSKRVWPAEMRLEMAQAIVDRGASASVLSETFGVSRFTLMDWAQQYRRRGVSGFQESGKKRGGSPRGGKDARREAVVKARRERRPSFCPGSSSTTTGPSRREKTPRST